MELSIVIINYKTPELTKKCVASIKKYPPKVLYEIIIIDNSNDNVGFAKGNNKGIKKARGKYILLLNSDTEVKKGSIDRLVEFAKNNPDAGAVVPKLLNKDGTTQASAFKFPSLWLAIRQYWFGEKNLLDKYIPLESNIDIGVMAAFLITPEAIKKVGLLDERYFMYFEDFDYCRRIKQKGLRVYYVSDSEVVHYHGASGPADWKRLIPGSRIYHGNLVHNLMTFILWTGQKLGKLIPIFLTVFLTIPAFFNLIRPGYFPMQDDLQAFRVHQMDKCFDDLQIPCRWVPDAGYQYGYPQFNYYPPLPYYIGALLHRTGIQYIDTVKILFIAGYILSAVTMCMLISTILKSPWSGLVAAAIYTYIPYKAVEVYVRGALSEFWAQIFFPLILWFIYKVIKTEFIKTEKPIYIVGMGLSISCLATTHALMTMIFAPIAIMWAIYWLIESKGKNILRIILGGFLGFGLSAFFILPVIFEKKFVHTESLLSGYFDYRAHFVNIYKLFISTEWGYGSSGFPKEKLNLSLGIVQWVVGLVLAPVLAISNFKKSKKFTLLTLAISSITLLSIFMIHMKSSFIWTLLPPLWYLQFPWRFLAVSIFLLTLLVGFVIYFSGKFKYVLGIVLIVSSFVLTISYFVPKDWLNITDKDKFSGQLWEKQLTISIFDYLPIYATLPPVHKAPNFPEVLEGNVKFIEYKKGSNYQTGIVDVSQESLIRLPLYDFPGMQVKIDNKIIPHVHNDCRDEKYCLGLITFNLPVGHHIIETRLADTPIRKIGNALTLISLGIVILIYISKL
jgi:GT2 family glycosyltransferase